MLYFLFAERPLTALIAVNIQSPCYVTNAEYYVTEFFIKGLQKHQGFIITTTVKPFYGTTTRGSGLNRLINCKMSDVRLIAKDEQYGRQVV